MAGKILVIDDVADTREIVHLYLSDEGYTVVLAATGAEGLYLANAEHPDLIITDLGLGDMDGTDVIKSIREHAELGATPIIALTALADVREEEAVRAGASTVVGKPMDLDALISRVRQMLA